MTEFVLDLSNYRDTVGARVEPGRYTVTVDDAEMDKSKAGNQMINVWYRINGGDFDGQTLTDRLVLTEKSLFRVVGFMSAIGLPTPRKRLKINLKSFIGKSLCVDVEDGEPYNGRVRSEIRGYSLLPKKASGQQAEDLDVADLTTEGGGDASEAGAEPATGQIEVSDQVQVAEIPDAPEEIDLDSIDL